MLENPAMPGFPLYQNLSDYTCLDYKVILERVNTGFRAKVCILNGGNVLLKQYPQIRFKVVNLDDNFISNLPAP